MNPYILVGILFLYFSLLLILAFITSKGATNLTFFIANRKSKWYLVAIGMIGTSLTGITFISVPGWVSESQFSYLQVVFGYLLGYFIIAYVLLPIYYKLKIPSIYTYLWDRFGIYSYKTGAILFIIARTIGAALRVYIVVELLHYFIFNKLGLSFYFTVIFFLFLMLLYTYKGGVKTLVYTDLLQTAGMVTALILTIIYISKTLNLNLKELINLIYYSDLSKIFFFEDINDKKFFFKQIIAGMFITVTMTGLDQEMMQKNISCNTLKNAQKNMITYAFILVIINFLFMILGLLLYEFTKINKIVIPIKSDHLFPELALNYFGGVLSIVFVVGIISATFPSADGALTSLTSIFCIDILGLIRKGLSEKQIKKTRIKVHILFTILFFIIIAFFYNVSKKALIEELLTIAGYTYGPLLGLYSYGILTKWKTFEPIVPFIAALSPLICYFLNKYSPILLNGYYFGFEIILINGLITFFLLFATYKLLKNKLS